MKNKKIIFGERGREIVVPVWESLVSNFGIVYNYPNMIIILPNLKNVKEIAHYAKKRFSNLLIQN